MGDLSPHFSRWEFTCHHCGALVGPDPALLAALEAVRREVAAPLTIVSGYRCPDYNRRVGGIRTSLHLIGYAADVPGGYMTVEQARRAGFHGVGIRRARVVHVDTDPNRGFYTFKD